MVKSEKKLGTVVYGIKIGKNWSKLVKFGARCQKLVKMLLVHVSSIKNGGNGIFWAQKTALKKSTKSAER